MLSAGDWLLVGVALVGAFHVGVGLSSPMPFCGLQSHWRDTRFCALLSIIIKKCWVNSNSYINKKKFLKTENHRPRNTQDQMASVLRLVVLRYPEEDAFWINNLLHR